MKWLTYVGSLWVSIVLAFLVGIAVPIALLGNYTFSLIGVAISTSLLPPSVNAGLLWAFSVRSINQDSINTLNLQYSSTRSVDFAIKGAMSICLTFINIICIFTCGIVILKIKAVSPKKYNTTRTSMDEYLNAMKEINLGLPKEETNHLTLRLREEYAFGISQNTLNIQGSCMNPLFNPFDLSFVTWSPGYIKQHNIKSFLNNQTADNRASKLINTKKKSIDPYTNETLPGSLKAIFESPKESYPNYGTNSTRSSSKRFVVTPVILKSTSNA